MPKSKPPISEVNEEETEGTPSEIDEDGKEPDSGEYESIDESLIEQTRRNKQQASSVSEGDLDATRLYLNEIGFSPLLSAEEEVYFARKALKGDEAARKRMIESNLRLVVKIARRYMNRGWLCLISLKKAILV